MKWLPFEIHTHTYHSDGDFTPKTLLEELEKFGICGTALTDHNTKSGFSEYSDALKSHKDMTGLYGMEWTTYFGHMLVIEENGFTEFRGVKEDEMDEALERINNNGGIVGIAHPYALSNPINTGYRWQFNITKWEHLDFLEIWSRVNAPLEQRSKFAMSLWTHLLNMGYRVSGTSGRDFHRPDAQRVYYCTTYLGFSDEVSRETAYDAIKNGRMCVTSSKLLTAYAEKDEKIYNVGDEMPQGEYKITFEIFDAKNEGLKTPTVPEFINIISNGNIIKTLKYDGAQKYIVDLYLEKGYMRADFVGEYQGVPDKIIAFTNPFYLT